MQEKYDEKLPKGLKDRQYYGPNPSPEPELIPDSHPLIDQAILRLKAALASGRLLVDSLEHLVRGRGSKPYDLNYYRMCLEEYGPFLNSLIDRMDTAQELLRMEAERQCPNKP